MEPGAVDPSALTFREKKTLFSSICSTECASPQVGRLNNPFSAPSSIRHQLEHQYPRYLTASAPDRVRLAPAKLFGDATSAGGGSSAAAFRRLSRQLSHKLILEAATQTEGRLSPAASAAAHQRSNSNANSSASSASCASAFASSPSPPHSPDLVAMLWLPEGATGPRVSPFTGAGGTGTPSAFAARAAQHTVVVDPSSSHRAPRCCHSGADKPKPLRSCGGGVSAGGARCGDADEAAPPPPDPQLRAVARLLSQFVAQSKERGLPVDPRVAQALRAAQSGQQAHQAQGHYPLGLDRLEPGHSGEPVAAAAEASGGGGGADGSNTDGEEAGTPRPQSPPPPVPPVLSPALDSSDRWVGEGVGEPVGELRPSGASRDMGVQADVEAPEEDESRAEGAASPSESCTGMVADSAGRSAAEAYSALQEQARQLQRQLQQRAMAQYDLNRTSAAALSRSLSRLQEAAAAAAVPSPTLSLAPAAAFGAAAHGSSDWTSPFAAAAGTAAVAATPAAAAAVPGPAAAADVADVTAQLHLEQQRRTKLAAQCARLQRQCNSLLSYVALISGRGGDSPGGGAAPAAAPPLSFGWPPSPVPSLAPGRDDAIAVAAALYSEERVRVRLVLLPCEGAGSGTAVVSDVWPEAQEGAEETQSEDEEDGVTAVAAAAAAAACREQPVRVKLHLTVCRSRRSAGAIAALQQQQQQQQAAPLPSWAAAALVAAPPYYQTPLAPVQEEESLEEHAAAAAAVTEFEVQTFPEQAGLAGGGGGGLTAAVQQLVAAVEEQASAAVVAVSAASGAAGNGAMVAPPVPQSVLNGLRGVLRQLRGGGDGDALTEPQPLADLPPHARPSAEPGPGRGRQQQQRQPHGKPPRPPASGFAAGATSAAHDGPQCKEAAAAAAPAATMDEGVNAAGSLSRRSRSMPAICAESDFAADEDEFEEGELYCGDVDAAAPESDAAAAVATAAASAAARPHGGRRVPTPPCSPRTTCSPTASQDLDDADLDPDLDPDLAEGSHAGSGSGSRSAAADGAGGGGSGSASCYFDDGGYFGYGVGPYGGGYGEAGDYVNEPDLDLDLAEWDELAAAAAVNGPSALLSAVGFLREQLQHAHLEIVSLNTQLGALSHQREGLRARASQHDAALQLLAIGEGEAVLEVTRLSSQLAAERVARARLSSQCEELQNMLLSGLPERPCTGTSAPLLASAHLLSTSSTSHPLHHPHPHPHHPLLGSPTKSKSSLGGGHPHPHPHPHHHSGSLQRLPHAHAHPAMHLVHPQHQQQHQQLQGSQAHQQLQQLLLQHQLQQHQYHHHHHQRPSALQRHRSAPRQRLATGMVSARTGEGSELGGVVGGLGSLGGLAAASAGQAGLSVQ